MSAARIAVLPGPEAAPALAGLLPTSVAPDAADALLLLDVPAADALLAGLIERGAPILATGSAALQLARLAGGGIESDTAPQFGFVDVEALPGARDDPVTAAAGEGLPLFLWQADAIVLPPNALLLFRCERGRVQGFRVGGAYGFRFRPELDAAAIRRLATERAARINNIGYRVRLVSEIERHIGRQVAFARAMVTAWLASVERSSSAGLAGR